MRLYSRQEATEINRPSGKPWSWSDPIQAIVQDSHKFQHLRPGAWTEFLQMCEGFIGNLYDRGFAIVKVDPDE